MGTQWASLVYRDCDCDRIRMDVSLDFKPRRGFLRGAHPCFVGDVGLNDPLSCAASRTELAACTYLVLDSGFHRAGQLHRPTCPEPKIVVSAGVDASLGECARRVSAWIRTL